MCCTETELFDGPLGQNPTATMLELPPSSRIDFARVDHSVEPALATVVARVGLSPLMLRQLIDRLTDVWEDHVDKIYGGVLPDDELPSTGGDEPSPE